jgi:ATP-binding cassette subfamily C protein
MTNGGNLFVSRYLYGAISTMIEICLVFILSVYLLFVNVLPALLLLFNFLVLLFFNSRVFGEKQKFASGRLAASEIKARRYLRDLLTGIDELITYKKVFVKMNEFESIRSKSVLDSEKQLQLAAIPRIILDAATMLSLLLICTMFYVLNSEASTVVSFFVAGSRLIPSLLKIQGGITQIRFSQAGSQTTKEVIELLKIDYESRVVNATDPNLNYSFKLEQVSYSVEGRKLFGPIDLEIAPSGLTLVKGESGAGKSTLISLLAGLKVPDSGKIIVPSRFSKFAFIPQSPHVFNSSVAENITLVRSDYDLQLLSSCLEVSGLKDFDEFRSLDNSQKELENLSGGEISKIGLARALYSQPSLILADEITAALDERNTLDILNSVKTLSKSMPIVVVSHEDIWAEAADWIIEFKRDNDGSCYFATNFDNHG